MLFYVIYGLHYRRQDHVSSNTLFLGDVGLGARDG